MAACPYDAIFINPDDHSAEKCNFCAHRHRHGPRAGLRGRLPGRGHPGRRRERPDVAGVGHGPAGGRSPSAGRRRRPGPSSSTAAPTQATLDPIAARRPGDDLYMWSEQGERASRSTRPRLCRLGLPRGRQDAPTRRPRPSSPTTSPTARRGTGGSASTPGPRASPPACGWWPSPSPWPARWNGRTAWCGGPRRSWPPPSWPPPAACSSGTSSIPGRFLLIMTRPQWRSWLVRGGFILGGYGAVLGAPSRSGGARAPTASSRVAAVPGRAAGGHGRRLHRLPVRPGQGPGPVAEPAAARRTWPSRPSWRGRPRWPSPTSSSTAAPGTSSAGSWPPPPPPTCCWCWARSRSAIPPPTPIWPPGR